MPINNSDLHRLLIFDRKYNCKFDHEWLEDVNHTNNTSNDQRRTSVASLVSAAMSNSQLPLFLPSSSSQQQQQQQQSSTAFKFYNKNEKAEESPMNKEDSRQLILGLVYSIRNMGKKMTHSSNPSSSDLHVKGTTNPIGEYSFQYSCNKYKLIFYESITGWRFVLMLHNNNNHSTTTTNSSTSSNIPNGILYDLYNSVFQECIIRNPLVDPQTDHFNRQSFINKIGEYFTAVK